MPYGRGPHRQRSEASQDNVVSEGWAFRQQAQVAIALQQRFKGDTAFETCQRGPETVVNAAAKGDVVGFLTRNVQTFWLCEDLGIMIGGTEQQDNSLAFSHLTTSNLHILDDGATVHLHRRIIPQEFFYCRRHELGLVSQSL
jgi:hypothetical protein